MYNNNDRLNDIITTKRLTQHQHLIYLVNISVVTNTLTIPMFLAQREQSNDDNNGRSAQTYSTDLDGSRGCVV